MTGRMRTVTGAEGGPMRAAGTRATRSRLAGRMRRMLRQALRPAPLLAGALALLAPCGTAAAEAAWETTVTVGNKLIVLPDDTPGEEWERGYRRQYCMPAYALGTQGALPLELEPPGFGIEGVPDRMRTQYDNCFGTVTDATFRYKGLSIGIEGIYHYTTQTALLIDFRRRVPVEDLDPLRGGRFEIGGRTFTVDDGLEGQTTFDGRTNFLMWAVPFWQDDMGWTVGDEIAVSFHPPASAAPELSSATVSATGREIALVFDESLDAGAGNGPPAGAFTVTADGGAVAVGAAAVDASEPRKVRLSGLSAAILPGQAVVVAYADPTDGDDGAAVQDADGNDAPSFATGADGVPAVVNGAVPLLSVADVTVTEGTDAEAEFAVSLAPAATETVTVDYATSDGTAEAGMDYTASSGTLTFNAGETSKTVSVPIADDDVEDSGETFTLTLSNPSGGGAALGDGQATATVLNDEGEAAPELLHAVANGKTVVLTYGAELDPDSVPPARAFTVKADGTWLALAARDPVAVSGATVTLALWSRVDRGHAVTVSYRAPSSNPLQDASANPVAALADHVARNDTTDTRAGSGGPAAHAGDPAWKTTVTVGSRVHLDNDRRAGGELVRGYDRQECMERWAVGSLPQPYPGLGVEDPEDRRSGYDNCFGTIGDDTLEHGDLTLRIEGIFHFVVERVVMIRFRDSVPRERLEGLRGGWFVLKDRKFPADWALRGSASEFDRFDWGADFWRADMGWTVGETVPVSFHPAGSAVPTLSVGNLRVTEGRDATADFTVRLSPAAAGTVTVDYATADGSARAPGDYTAASGTLTFAPGETEKTVSVPIVDDSVEDSGEKFTLRLSNASGGAAILGYGRATATIANHELTAEFSGAPAGHGGEPFTLELAFNDSPEMSYRVLQPVNGREGRLNLVNATALRVRRADRDSDRRWLLSFEPTGTGDVTVTLPATTDCEAAGAVCTADGRPLSAPVTVTVPHGEPGGAEAPFAASLEALPEEHDGEGEVTFELRFSEEPQSYSFRTLRDETLEIRQGGTRLAPRVQRMARPSNRSWTVTVEPASKADIAIAVAAAADCEAAGAVCNADGEPLSAAVEAVVPGPPGLSAADATVTEAAGAVLDFRVVLGRASASTVTVDYRTWDGTATAGADYTATSGTLGFAPGETSKTVSVPVLDDAHDEGAETLVLALSNPSGGNAWIADAHATGTIENTDAMPEAWLARFGRTVAEQVVEAVEGRFAAPRRPGVAMTLAGERIGWSAGTEKPGPGAGGEARRAAAEEAEARLRLAAMTDWLRGAEDGTGSVRTGRGARAVTTRGILAGSSFALTGETAAGGPVSLWARGAVSRFDGIEGDLALDGEVASAMLGADWSGGPGSGSPGSQAGGPGRWTAGLLVSRSVGEGGYRGPESQGAVESTLTGVFPYGRHALNERVSVWGIAGYGAGELVLTPKNRETGASDAAMRTDMDLAMGAAGLRGVAVEAGPEGGLELAVETDAMAVRTTSEKVEGLEAAKAGVTRLRLALEGSWRGLTLGSGALAPNIEIGLRHDGGDAETGFGLDLGGGLAWSDPASGLGAEVRARGLLTHDSKGFRDRGLSGAFSWAPGRGAGRGPSLTLTQTLGGPASGGADALLGRGTMAGLAANDPASGSGADDDLANRRLELRMGYGFAAFGGRFAATPELGLGLSNGRRDYTLGWRLGTVGGGTNAFEVRFEARRQETPGGPGGAEPVHDAGLRVTARW